MIVGIRHARVWNPHGLVYARLPGFHLSEEGRAAAQALSEALVDAPVLAVYASPLDRAKGDRGHPCAASWPRGPGGRAAHRVVLLGPLAGDAVE